MKRTTKRSLYQVKPRGRAFKLTKSLRVKTMVCQVARIRWTVIKKNVWINWPFLLQGAINSWIAINNKLNRLWDWARERKALKMKVTIKSLHKRWPRTIILEPRLDRTKSMMHYQLLSRVSLLTHGVLLTWKFRKCKNRLARFKHCYGATSKHLSVNLTIWTLT